MDSLDPFLNQNNEKKIDKIVKKVRKSSLNQSHDFDLTWLGDLPRKSGIMSLCVRFYDNTFSFKFFPQGLCFKSVKN